MTAPLPFAGRPAPGPGQFIPPADLQALRHNPLDALLAVANRYGGVLKYPVGFWNVFLVSHPDAVQHVLKDRQRAYSKATFQYNLLAMLAGRGLLSSDGAFWLRQRRLMQPAFHRERLATMADAMAESAAALAGRWVRLDGTALDVEAEMLHLTLTVVGRALFNVDLHNRADAFAQAALRALEHVLARGRQPFGLPAWVPTPGNRRFAAAQRTLDAAVYQIIARHRAAPDRSGDLLALLLAASDDATGEGMSDQQLRDEIITLLIAGHETVASALTWTWYLLSQDPHAEQTLHDELATVLGGRTPTAADLARLPYTRMVFDEALRLYPPWLITRRALENDVVGGYLIPAGALVAISPYVTHRHPAFWDAPEAFRPERFAPEATANRHRYAYVPFGGGPHLCIGNTFAQMEACLVLATVAQQVRLRLVPGHPVVPEPTITVRPKYGMQMRIERRESVVHTT